MLEFKRALYNAMGTIENERTLRGELLAQEKPRQRRSGWLKTASASTGIWLEYIPDLAKHECFLTGHMKRPPGFGGSVAGQNAHFTHLLYMRV
jgi:hypothetical protein